MFKLFKKKSESEKLQEKYNRLMIEWHELSSVNRSKSDQKYAEAQQILDTLEELQAK